MNRERLMHLIGVLEEVERANKPFNLTHWVTGEIDPATTHNAPRTSDEEPCGTAACACGYAALDPQFQREGLRLEATFSAAFGERSHHLLEHAGEIASWSARLAAAPPGAVLWFDLAFDGRSGFEAASRFFGVTQNASWYLFDPDYYEDAEDRPIEPSEVIARIQEVIALDGEAPEGWREVG